MREDLRQIDTSPIEQLVRIKDEQSVLRDRLSKMEETRESVSPVVFKRVRADYESRLAALDTEARPLKEHARREYGKLRTLHLGMERSFDDAKLEKEELEFRDSLGEFEREDFDARLAECEQKLAERQSDLDDAAELKASFLTAFNSEDELNQPSAQTAPPPAPQPPPAEPEPVAEPEPPQPAVPQPPPSIAAADQTWRVSPLADPSGPPPVFSADATTVAPMPVAAPAPAPPPPPADATTVSPMPFIAPPSAFSGDATTVAPMAPTAPGAFSSDATTVVPMPVIPSAQPAGATVVMTMPRVIALVGDKPGQEYVLKPGTTTVGRSPKAQIRVLEESVSRQHAQVIFGPEGCKIVDLGSENGTNINGQRVSEHQLADGDLIQIGAQRFIFRA
jgi:hypothetical protein